MAAVNGPAVGIGCSLALACDIVLAAESAFFGLAFVNIGLMPDGGSTLFVPAAVGKARAFQMALLGERVESARALEWGLVNEVHPDDELLPAAEALVAKFAAGPTRSYAGSKRALNQMLYPHLDEQLALEADLQHELARTEDFMEGVGAFVERREPAFKGIIGALAPLWARSPRSRFMRRVPGYDPAALQDRPKASRRRLIALALAAAGRRAAGARPRAPRRGSSRPSRGGSPNADEIDRLYRIVLYVSIPIFLLVEGTLIWSLIKYRERRGGPEPAQIRGNTPLELGWTIGATVILVVLAAVTFIYLGDIKNPPASGPNGLASGVQVASIDQPDPPPSGGEPLDIDVNGQQYLWRYDYPGGVFDYYEMVVPTNTTVTLKITAVGRPALVVDPRAGRQGRRRAGPHQRDVVQDLQAWHLQGPVRRAVRRQPRRHARAGARRDARGVPGLRRAAQAGASRRRRPAWPSSGASARSRRRGGPGWRLADAPGAARTERAAPRW